ncbi:aminoglycoside phosphotransferase family protein [Phenylobacterium sp.]|jgi:aminoglycoside phosphotransferase (APT) family kinase protein|uniref:aminoglycoside phosphotransferase family protein n=1 Tax=Phenylobacterium sp. TaxID=1871053 RepID=UPI002E2FA8E1|nr:aminoglycoside phosphotransferase family protein [Phenylobacterium sp.]HEX2558439.1 aminoglycoside phosphotransferase family protein [Phenylobacterium sp.]
MKVKIDAAFVGRLVAAQFPQWADLEVRPVAFGGNNNRSFHLGPDMSVRLPRAWSYAAQVDKEQAWLPTLAPKLPLPIPEPLALGQPADGYPWRWSIYRWIDGETASAERVPDTPAFARDLAAFLKTLQGLDTAGGPAPGPHNFLRGLSPAVYDAQTREALADLEGEIDTALAEEVWEAALGSQWEGPPVWSHGDVAAGNLLVKDGKLSAVIDWGIMSVGDPACDLTIAWTLFDAEARAAFRDALPLDPGTWARGRGWALWKALILLAGPPGNHPDAANAPRVLQEILEDHRASG